MASFNEAVAARARYPSKFAGVDLAGEVTCWTAWRGEPRFGEVGREGVAVKIYRVVVRGQFADLDEAQRASLLAKLRDHDFLKSSFTADGTFTYDARLDSFNLRFEVRMNDESVASLSPLEVEDVVAGEMVDKAEVWLQNAGHPFKRLRATVTDMASMWSS